MSRPIRRELPQLQQVQQVPRAVSTGSLDEHPSRDVCKRQVNDV